MDNGNIKNLIYRKAEEKDIKGIAYIVSELLGTCSLDENKSIIDNNIQEIAQTIDLYYVCEIDNKIIGACGLSLVKDKDDFNLGLKKIHEILYLVVDKSYQRNGIGTTLLKICCDNANYDIMYEAWGDNGKYVNSKFILEKCGFELYKNLGSSYYKEHNYCALCVNRNKQCDSCLAEIWIKRKD